MSLSEKTKQLFREFLYEQNRNRGHNTTKDKNMFLSDLSEIFDEMDEYIDKKVKAYETTKKNKQE